jgi:hypothetical protein
LACEVFIGKLTTTVTTGVISSTTALNAAIIANFASRFGLFDEYLIESALLRFDCCSSSNPGIFNVWCEPESGATSAPAATDAKNNKTLTFSCGDNSKTHVLRFNPHNPNTQIWTPITTVTQTCGNLKVYTNNADFGSTTVATDYVVVTGVMNLAFRGFG